MNASPRDAVAVVQARMSSRRLPGKVLATVGEDSVLGLLLGRLAKARSLDEIVVATSVAPEDDAIALAAEAASVRVFRGPLDDVLERYRLAAVALGCEGIVRITADCPLIDPEVVDRVVSEWKRGEADYVANTFEPRTYPDGLDVEVISTHALVAAAAEATDTYEREHVTPFVRDRPERFPQERVELDPPHGDVRVTLDTEEDLRRIRTIVERAGADVDLRGMLEVLVA